jgi:hypothetical protein
MPPLFSRIFDTNFKSILAYIGIDYLLTLPTRATEKLVYLYRNLECLLKALIPFISTQWGQVVIISSGIDLQCSLSIYTLKRHLNAWFKIKTDNYLANAGCLTTMAITGPLSAGWQTEADAQVRMAYQKLGRETGNLACPRPSYIHERAATGY